jgi:hypothetical protein
LVLYSNESKIDPDEGSLTIPIYCNLRGYIAELLCFSGKEPPDKLNDSDGFSCSRFLKMWMTPLLTSKTKYARSIPLWVNLLLFNGLLTMSLGRNQDTPLVLLIDICIALVFHLINSSNKKLYRMIISLPFSNNKFY